MWREFLKECQQRLDSPQLFLKVVSFRSHDMNWSKEYLGSHEARLTSLLKNKLKNDFWEHYSRVLVSYHHDGRLLMRTKSIQDEDVILSQVWLSKKCYQSFLQEALMGHSLRHYFEEIGLNVKEEERIIREYHIARILVTIQAMPHIIQFLHPKYRLLNTIIGDPLKKGKLYLPFPDQR
jgi:hypothetical protein